MSPGEIWRYISGYIIYYYYQRKERTHLVFGAHFGVERGHKTMDNSMPDCIKQWILIIIWRTLAHKIIVLQHLWRRAAQRFTLACCLGSNRPFIFNNFSINQTFY